VLRSIAEIANAGRQRTESSTTADDPIDSMKSLSVLIGDAARAFGRLPPVALAEVSTHAMLAHDASDQVTTAARQAYMHHPPRMRRQCFAGFRNPRIDACRGKALCHRSGRACW
jgi:hypothetical protein